jgi:hypothetical protein
MSHHLTADMCFKVADHYLRKQVYIEAKLVNLVHYLQTDFSRKLFDQAVQIYGHHDFFMPERARLHHKIAALFTARGEHDQAAESSSEAQALYRKLVPQDQRPVSELVDADFDKQITFWSR